MKQKQKEKDLADEENFGNSSWGQFRAWLWNVLEYPWTSRLAEVSCGSIGSLFALDKFGDTEGFSNVYLAILLSSGHPILATATTTT